jgi:hypothetical protein
MSEVVSHCLERLSEVVGADLSGKPGNQDFRIFSGVRGVVENAHLGARKSLQNGQKYL